MRPSLAERCLNPSAGLICLLAFFRSCGSWCRSVFKSLGWVDMPSGNNDDIQTEDTQVFKSLGWVDMPSGHKPNRTGQRKYSLNPSAGLICLLALSVLVGRPVTKEFKSLGWVDMPSGMVRCLPPGPPRPRLNPSAGLICLLAPLLAPSHRPESVFRVSPTLGAKTAQNREWWAK